MSASLLLLADGRLPAGGHAHSGGVEAAVADGSLTGLEDLRAFLAGRLATTGLVSAAFAAAACAGADPAELDRELDARTAAPALRSASRAQGRALLRAGRAGWPGLRSPVAAPHHPVALGLVAAAARLTPLDAALASAHGTVGTPAWAAVRLLSLDPLKVAGVLAQLAPAVDAVAAAAVAVCRGPIRDLPAAAAVRLDLLAEAHKRAGVRLFAS